MNRKKILELVKDKLRHSYSKEDLLQHASHAIDELDETTNLLFERLKNWYSIYLPEIKELEDREKYLKIVESYEKGINPSGDLRKYIPPESLGADLEGEDLTILKEYGRSLRQLFELREELIKYRDKTIEKIAPNLNYLLGPVLATKLVVEAKGLKRLAQMPASTIQVLGAEKALFMHLTRHTKPPKHGIIFLHQTMRGLPKKLRGKVARILAAKISIAAKADAYSHKFIAPKLKEEMDKKIEDIRSKA